MFKDLIPHILGRVEQKGLMKFRDGGLSSFGSESDLKMIWPWNKKQHIAAVFWVLILSFSVFNSVCLYVDGNYLQL